MEEETQNTVMFANDTLSASMAKCFVTIGDRRYNFMSAINLETRVKKKKTKVPILGKTGGGNKATGWEGEGKATFHFNTSIFRKAIEEYKNTGKDLYFDIQIINEDKDSSAGRQEIMLLDCNLDDVVLAKYDADGEYLDEDMNFTFEDFSVPKSFNELDGFALSE